MSGPWQWPPGGGLLLCAVIGLLMLLAMLLARQHSGRHQAAELRPGVGAPANPQPAAAPEKNSTPRRSRSPAWPADAVMKIGPGAADWLLLEHCVSNIFISGQVGSSKTTGVGANLALGLLRHPTRPAVLVLCQKPDEAARWIRYAELTGRSSDILHVKLGGEQKLDIIRYELAAFGGGSDSAAILLDVILEAANRNRQRNSADAYWPESSGRQMRCAMALTQMGLGYSTLEHVLTFCQSLPISADQVRDPEWRKRSFAAACVLKASEEFGETRAFQLAANYVLDEWPNLSDKTRSIVQSVTVNTLDKLLSGQFADLISGGEITFTPEQVFEDGRIVLLDEPGSVYGLPAQWVQAALKVLFQRAAMRRDLTKACRPFTIWADEAANFCVPEQDALFLSQGRQFRTICVNIVQNLPLVYTALGSSEAARMQAMAWVSNHCTVFCAANSCPETNGHFSALFGEEKEQLFGGSLGGNQEFDLVGDLCGLTQSNVQTSWSEQYRPSVPGDRFATLSRGGRENGFVMQAYVHQSGRVFSNGKTFLRASFDQVI